MAAMHAAVLALVASATSAQPSTKPVVLVMTNPDASGSGFVDSLRIQLINSGIVQRGPMLGRGGLAKKLARARSLAAKWRARLVVWIERKRRRRNTEYVLHVVNPKKHASNVELFRIQARAGPDVDRTLALKVSGVLDQVLAGTSVPTSVWAPPPVWGWTVVVTSLGWLGNGEPSTQGALAIGGGRQVEWGKTSLSFGLLVAADLGVHRTAGAAKGEVQTRELVPSAFVAVLRRLGTVSAGLWLESRVRLVHATGRTTLDVQGSRVVVVPTFAALMDVRISLSTRFELRLAVGGDVATRRRRFAVNGIELVDLGRFRGEVQVGLIAFLR